MDPNQAVKVLSALRWSFILVAVSVLALVAGVASGGLFVFAEAGALALGGVLFGAAAIVRARRKA